MKKKKKLKIDDKSDDSLKPYGITVKFSGVKLSTTANRKLITHFFTWDILIISSLVLMKSADHNGLM